jgi:hypothetical protein
MVCMIGTYCLEKLLEVIHELPRLALEIMLNDGNEFLIRVTSILVMITLIKAGGDCD